MKGDWDNDGDVDRNDIRGLMRAIQAKSAIDLAFDINSNGVVDILDARAIMKLCSRSRCAP